MTKRLMNAAPVILALLAAGLCALPAMAQAGEGYDPMRQITTQIARPNIMIVQDVSGSMAGDINGNGSSADDFGTVPTGKWTETSSTTGCTGKKKYTYTLTLSQQYPSRLATVKNVLGSHITIVNPYTPGNELATPVSIPANNAAWAGIAPTYTKTLGATNTWVWKWTGTTCVAADPGIPINIYDSTPGTPVLISVVNTTYYGPFTLSSSIPVDCTQEPPIEWGDGGCTLAPFDIVGVNAPQVNWGLMEFTSSGATSCPASYTVTQAIDSNDTGVVTSIEAALDSVANGGLDAGGNTPTKGALDYVGTISAGITSGLLKTVYTADPKKLCGRAYAAVLVTDGLSNACNPSSGSNWIYPCGSCPGPTCCDTQSDAAKDNCPANYTVFPAGSAENIWNQAFYTSGAPYTIMPHVWTIGISNQVNPCELNYTAYRGRTDASSPNNDAGFGYVTNVSSPDYLKPLDYRLPTPASTVTVPSGKTAGVYDPSSPYAYFATTAKLLYAAFAKIVAGAGTGNYTTAAPSISASSPTTSGTVGLLPSMEFPSWRGHLYAYDLSRCVTTGCTLTSANCTGCPTCTYCTGTVAAPVPAPPLNIWDAGEVLSRAASATPPPPVPVGTDHTNGRSIYTWNPSNSNSLVEVTLANASTLNADLLVLRHNDKRRGFHPRQRRHLPEPALLHARQAGLAPGGSVNSTAAIVSAPPLDPGDPSQPWPVRGHLRDAPPHGLGGL